MSGPRVARWLLAASLAAAAVVAAELLLAFSVPLPSRLRERPSTVVEFEDGTPAFVFLAPDDRLRMEADPEDVDPRYLEALVRFEDRRFFRHAGVDWLAVVRSAWANLAAGRVVSGASTLPMQLVRVLEPRPRTLRSKAIEALRAAQLELHLDKSEILAAYLTFVPFGRNVEGVTAASWAFFGHGPERLTAAEIATLLAVPQRPSKRYPSPENGERLRKARDEIAAWLLAEGLFTERELGDAGDTSRRPPPRDEILARIQRQPVPERIRPLPRAAPHLAFWLRQRHPTATRLRSTLERGAQALVEQRTAAIRSEMRALGIRHGAVVVVDHGTGALRAVTGSLDFWGPDDGAQIPGFDVPRSPGSALKPFLYALALERGVALPEQLVADIPVRYGDYAPHNYDGSYEGLVRLEDALSRSRNVPFVELLRAIGVADFLALLRAGGAGHLHPDPMHYGLSAAIGTVEITPLELAALYAALAEGGRLRPVRVLAGDRRDAHARTWLAPGAAWLTRRALARRDRPDFPSRRRVSALPRDIHWKTGTSYGHRDAWAAGSDRRHTVVVWLGNFDRRPAADLVGAEAAGPLLFDLLEALADRSAPAAARGVVSFPRDLQTVEVCADSGFRAHAACPRRTGVLALRHAVPTALCPFHIGLDVDRDTGLALNPSCRTGHDWERRSFAVVPAAVRRYLRARQERWPAPPPLDPSCEPRASATARLAILSPLPGQTLFLIPGVPAEQQEVPLLADAGGATTELSWFVDGRFLGRYPASTGAWWQPSSGRHELLVADDTGRSARTTLVVRRR